MGQAYWALAMVTDQAGRWNLARRYMRQAARADMALLRSLSFTRRLLKLHAGQPIVNLVRGKPKAL